MRLQSVNPIVGARISLCNWNATTGQQSDGGGSSSRWESYLSSTRATTPDGRSACMHDNSRLPTVFAVILGLSGTAMLPGCAAEPSAMPRAEANALPEQKQPTSATETKPAADGKGRHDKDLPEAPEWHFPKTAFDYAKMVERELGVPPKIDLSQSVEIPLYVKGVQTYGNLGRSCDNYSMLGKDTVSGSVLQRHEGRTADGTALPDVVWVSFGRNSTRDTAKVMGSVQMIGYHKTTGATAFFESCDRIEPWVTLDEGTMRMRGVMPWVDDPDEFNKAYRAPEASRPQCVQCHQADPFITNPFINAAKIPGTKESVVPVLDGDSPYFVIGGDNWDLRTIHIDGNKCFECHRIGMSTMTMFMDNGWDPNQHMPPRDPGSLSNDLAQLMTAWQKGPSAVQGARWIVPPAAGKERQTVGDDYPYKARFNNPARKVK